MKKIILAIIVALMMTACKCEDSKYNTKTPRPKFETGQIVYSRLTGEKVLIVSNKKLFEGYYYYVRDSAHSSQGFFEFELTKNEPQQSSSSSYGY